MSSNVRTEGNVRPLSVLCPCPSEVSGHEGVLIHLYDGAMELEVGSGYMYVDMELELEVELDWR